MCWICAQGNSDGFSASGTGAGFDEAAPTSGYPRSNKVFDALFGGDRWSDTTLTFSFPTQASNYAGYGSNYPDTFSPVTEMQKTAARAVLADIQNFTNISFQEVAETDSSHATLRFARTTAISTAVGYYPNWYYEEGGDTWYRSGSYDSPVLGSYEYDTFIHELGHAFGLKHGHETSNFGALPTEVDSNEYSTMTYRDHVGDASNDGSENEAWGNGQTFMMYDIAALQWMYGADFEASGSTGSGDSVYTFSATTGEMFVNGVGQGTPGGNRIFRTVWDGNGTDTYDLGNYTTDLSIDLRPGEWSTFAQNQLADLDGGSRSTNLARGNLANALLYFDDLRSLIENAIGGSGNDTITGNQGDNVLTGNGGNDTLVGNEGNDTLRGGAGNDTMRGGTGDDTYEVSDSGDVVVENAGEGFDTVYISVGWSVPDTVERAFLIGSATTLVGSALANTLIGSALDNTLYGMAGADYIEGRDGKDIIAAGADDDTVLGGNGDDAIFGEGGRDTLYGNDGADTIFGNDDNDTIAGGIGDDILVGGAGNDVAFGEAGNDTLYGEDGDDTLFGDDGNDIISAGSGVDTIVAGLGDDFAAGDGDNDLIYGEAGADHLRGEAGNDTITGGIGNDILVGGIGDDMVFGDGDNDTLWGESGADHLRGDTGNDTIFGGTENDILVGGAGNDVLWGEQGDDRMWGEGGDDVFVFGIGFGRDIVNDWGSTLGFDDAVRFVSGLTSFDQVLAASRQVASDVVITLNASDTLTIANTQIAQFTASDFLFA